MSSLGIKLMMLGMVLPWGAERLLMMHVFPVYFLVAIPRGLMQKLKKWRTGEQSDHGTFFKFLSEWAVD